MAQRGSIGHIRKKELPGLVPVDQVGSDKSKVKGRPVPQSNQQKRPINKTHKGSKDEDDDDTPPPNLEKLREVRRQKLKVMKNKLMVADNIPPHKPTAKDILKEDTKRDVEEAKARILNQEQVLMIIAQEKQDEQNVLQEEYFIKHEQRNLAALYSEKRRIPGQRKTSLQTNDQDSVLFQKSEPASSVGFQQSQGSLQDNPSSTEKNVAKSSKARHNITYSENGDSNMEKNDDIAVYDDVNYRPYNNKKLLGRKEQPDTSSKLKKEQQQQQQHRKQDQQQQQQQQQQQRQQQQQQQKQAQQANQRLLEQEQQDDAEPVPSNASQNKTQYQKKRSKLHNGKQLKNDQNTKNDVNQHENVVKVTDKNESNSVDTEFIAESGKTQTKVHQRKIVNARPNRAAQLRLENMNKKKEMGKNSGQENKTESIEYGNRRKSFDDAVVEDGVLLENMSLQHAGSHRNSKSCVASHRLAGNQISQRSHSAININSPEVSTQKPQIQNADTSSISRASFDEPDNDNDYDENRMFSIRSRSSSRHSAASESDGEEIGGHDGNTMNAGKFMNGSEETFDDTVSSDCTEIRGELGKESLYQSSEDEQ